MKSYSLSEFLAISDTIMVDEDVIVEIKKGKQIKKYIGCFYPTDFAKPKERVLDFDYHCSEKYFLSNLIIRDGHVVDESSYDGKIISITFINKA